PQSVTDQRAPPAVLASPAGRGPLSPCRRAQLVPADHAGREPSSPCRRAQLVRKLIVHAGREPSSPCRRAQLVLVVRQSTFRLVRDAPQDPAQRSLYRSCRPYLLGREDQQLTPQLAPVGREWPNPCRPCPLYPAVQPRRSPHRSDRGHLCRPSGRVLSNPAPLCPPRREYPADQRLTRRVHPSGRVRSNPCRRALRVLCLRVVRARSSSPRRAPERPEVRAFSCPRTFPIECR